MRFIASLATTLLVVLPLAAQTPNYRDGAPFRAKLSPPHAEGEELVVGRSLALGQLVEGDPGKDRRHGDEECKEYESVLGHRYGR